MTSLRYAFAGAASLLALAAGGAALGADADKLIDADAATAQQSIARDPTDLPPPLARRAPQTVKLDLETVEREGQLADASASATGPSTARCRVPSPACASATRCRCP